MKNMQTNQSGQIPVLNWELCSFMATSAPVFYPINGILTC